MACRFLSLLGWLFLPGSLFAATLLVDTTADESLTDGLCSLREAVEAANTNLSVDTCPAGEPPPVIDEIQIPPGTYSITQDRPPEEAGGWGDFDLEESVVLRGLGPEFIWYDDPDTPAVETLDVFGDPEGFPREFTEADLPPVLIENGLGPADPGETSRVFQIDGEGDIEVTFENLAIVGGDARDGGGAAIHAERGESAASTRVTLRRVVLFGHRSDRGGAVLFLTGSDLTIEDSVFSDNFGFCSRFECSSGQVVRVESGGSQDVPEVSVARLLFTGNSASCSTDLCQAGPLWRVDGGDQSFEQIVATRSVILCEGAECRSSSVFRWRGEEVSDSEAPLPELVVRDVEVSSGRQECFDAPQPSSNRRGLMGCRVSETIKARGSFGSRRFERLRISDYLQSCGGNSCRVQSTFNDLGQDRTLLLEDVESIGNLQVCGGDRCEAEGVLLLVSLDQDLQMPGEAQAHSVVLSGNSVRCEGSECRTRPLSLFLGLSQVTGLSLVGNENSCEGDGCAAGVIGRFESPTGHPVTDLTVTDNLTSCSGDGCSVGLTCNIDLEVCEPGDGGTVTFRTFNEESQDLAGGPPSRASFTVNDSVFQRNHTSATGAAIANSADLLLDTCLIEDNVSDQDGAAVYNGQVLGSAGPALVPGRLEIRNTVISGNTAQTRGGAIYNPPGAILTLVESTLTDNVAGEGGGVWNEGSLRVMTSSTLEGNLPKGTDCVDSGQGGGCSERYLFVDGFESGDPSNWLSETGRWKDINRHFSPTPMIGADRSN